MSTITVEPWMMLQVERLAKSRPESLARLLCALRRQHPEAFEEMVLLALEHGDLTSAEAGVQLGISEAEVSTRHERLRSKVCDGEEYSLIAFDGNGVAKVKGTVVAVWEVVRQFRRSQSVAELHAMFPSLTEMEVRSALAYAGRNPDQIHGQIRAFEEFRTGGSAALGF